MIVKKLDPFSSEGKKDIAGRNAEENLAFYLKRFFADDKDILVLNGIRFESMDDAAQVDHLIIHAYGLILIECKSVAGKIQLLDDGQWLRWYADNSQGMKSPVTQVMMQAKFFQKELNRVTKQANFFDHVPFDTLVALSDNGHFIAPKNAKRPVEVCKADQVPERILRIIQHHKANSTKPLFVEKQMQLLADFLCKSNKPLQKKISAQRAPISDVLASPVDIKQAVDAVHLSQDSCPDKLTTAKLAEARGLKTNNLMQILHAAGYLEYKDQLSYLTAEGKKAGGEFRRGSKHGMFFLWPANLDLKGRLASKPAFLTPTSLGHKVKAILFKK